jgi:hypothetical protein
MSAITGVSNGNYKVICSNGRTRLGRILFFGVDLSGHVTICAAELGERCFVVFIASDETRQSKVAHFEVHFVVDQQIRSPNKGN